MNENTYKGEITFQSIFALIKKSFVRIVVFVIIAAVFVGLSGTILLVLTREDPSYQAIIEFNYEGAEDGLNPWGGKLDVSKIKADKIIADALKDNNFSLSEMSRLKSKIKNNISIAGIVPEDIMEQILIIREIATKNPLQLNDLNSLSYTSTSYVVSLKNTKEMGLNSKQCINLLNSIIDKFIDDFRQTYGFNEVLGTLIANEIMKDEINSTNYDYVELFDMYDTQIQDIIRFLDYIILDAKNFRATTNSLTFDDMKSRIVSIQKYDLRSLETYIFDKGIKSEDSKIEVETYIEEKLSKIDIEIEATQKLLDDTITAMTEIFQPYYNTRKDANGNEEKFLANGEIYQQYSDNLMLFQARLVEQTTEKTLWTNRSEKFQKASKDFTETERQEYRDYADLMLEEINEDLVLEIKAINEAVDEYIENDVMKDSITKAVSAVKTPINTLNIKILILLVVLAVFIAFIAALVVTSNKEKKAALVSKENNKTTENKSLDEKSE